MSPEEKQKLKDFARTHYGITYLFVPESAEPHANIQPTKTAQEWQEHFDKIEADKLARERAAAKEEKAFLKAEREYEQKIEKAKKVEPKPVKTKAEKAPRKPKPEGSPERAPW